MTSIICILWQKEFKINTIIVFFNGILIDKQVKAWYYETVPREQNRKTGYSQHKEEFVMIRVAIEKNDWYDYKESAWCGAISTLNEVEKQDREEEAIEIIEEYMSELL